RSTVAPVGDTGPTEAECDTKQQPKVVERLLLLHIEHWTHVIENTNAYSTPQTPDVKVSMLGPLTALEQQLSKTLSSSLSQKVQSTFSITTTKFGGKSK
uniref:Uncharacterized protein n=1 Tax=Anser brachyrhynchus TaxID=132585 RepID=A0A8B9CYU3_9AVES